MGISGCGHLASSIASLAPKHLVPITRRLIKFASRLESKAKEEREQESIDEEQENNWFARAERRKDIIMNRARFLSTISSLVLEMKEDPPSDITRAIVETVQSLIVEFPDLYKGYRDFICIAISRAYVVFERENFNHFSFHVSIMSLKSQEYHSRKATLKRTLKYYENLTRASRSNTGTLLLWIKVVVP